MRFAALAAAALLMAAPAAHAQTLTLRSLRDSTIRGGSYATHHYGNDPILETRASSDGSYLRRAVLMFATAEALPQSATISSAKLVLTVKSGNGQKRTLTACAVPVSFREPYVNWKMRDSNSAWRHAGGDIVTGDCSTATVTATKGSHVVFDVTAQTRKAVKGSYGSRYARFLIGDPGASSRDSYKQYYSSEAGTASLEPTLLITKGSGTTSSGTSTPPPPSNTTSGSSSSGKLLRVLQWNTHHGGYGTDGKYSPDRLASWAAKMKPDVIMFNEIEKFTGWGNQNQPEVYKSLLQQKTGKKWYYLFAQEFGNWSSNGKGNLILSTYPLAWNSRYELVHNGDRSIAAVSIKVNSRNITLLSTHLDPYSQSLRLTQAKEVTTWAAPQPENRIVTGDMNAWPDQTSIAQLNQNYKDSWAVALAAGHAIAFSGNHGETKKGRIDYIFYSKGAPNLSVVSSQVYDTRDSRGVMPSDHRPVLTVFRVN